MTNLFSDNGVLVRANVFSIQVCVPADWTDEQVIEFAERSNPCGTQNGWQIRRDAEYEKRREKDPSIVGTERVQCLDNNKRVHIVLDA